MTQAVILMRVKSRRRRAQGSPERQEVVLRIITRKGASGRMCAMRMATTLRKRGKCANSKRNKLTRRRPQGLLKRKLRFSLLILT